MKKLLFAVLLSVLVYGCGDSGSSSGGGSWNGGEGGDYDFLDNNVTVGMTSGINIIGNYFNLNGVCTYPTDNANSVEFTILDKATESTLATLSFVASGSSWENLNGVEVETGTFVGLCIGTAGSGETDHIINCGNGNIEIPTDAALVFKCTDGEEEDTLEVDL